MNREEKLIQQELEKRKKNAYKSKGREKNLNNNNKISEEKNINKNEKQNQKEPLNNTGDKELVRVTMVFAILFLGMIVYYLYFLSTDSKLIINNSYNKRIANYANTITRGKIYTADEECIAYTDTNDNGEEERIYPYSNIYCHVVGINSLEHGKTGLEKLCDYDLLTSNINPILKIIYELRNEKCLGNNIYSTIDSKAQQLAYDALGENDGAIVVIDNTTGAILAMVSKPDYNPNELEKIWEQLYSEDKDEDVSDLEKKDSFLLNRATQGQYIPGSIFKIFTTVEYLRQNDYIDEYSFYCDGEDYNIKCYNGLIHGEENLVDAFAYSCNGAFADIGIGLDMDKMKKDMDMLLFNNKLPFELEHSKSKFIIDNDSSDFDKTQTAIGQGFTTVTPIHMAMVVQAIANNGIMMKPYVVSEIKGYDGTTINKYEPTEIKRLFTKKEASMLKTYMDAVVDYGTAKNLNNDQYVCGGKTGTAQIDKDNSVNSWFVGYASNNERNISISICLENVKDGTVKAVNCSQYFLDNYLK